MGTPRIGEARDGPAAGARARRALAVVLLAASPLALARSDGSDDDLAAKATDPTAQLISFGLSDWYAAGGDGSEGSSNQIVFRAALPFDLAGTKHIFRITQPYSTSGRAGSGWNDTTIFDLVVFDQPWGRWGVGVSGTVPTGSAGLSSGTWTAGPAIGFVNASTPAVNWGLFVQAFFSFAGERDARDVRVVNLQPILSHRLGCGRSLSLGNSALVYDAERSRWASLLASVNYGQVVTFAGHKWRPNVEAGYDFRNGPGTPTWVVRAGIVLLLPT
jgi:hypothetical protein